jgi:hypothetical protein
MRFAHTLPALSAIRPDSNSNSGGRRRRRRRVVRSRRRRRVFRPNTNT